MCKRCMGVRVCKMMIVGTTGFLRVREGGAGFSTYSLWSRAGGPWFGGLVLRCRGRPRPGGTGALCPPHWRSAQILPSGWAADCQGRPERWGPRARTQTCKHSAPLPPGDRRQLESNRVPHPLCYTYPLTAYISLDLNIAAPLTPRGICYLTSIFRISIYKSLLPCLGCKTSCFIFIICLFMQSNIRLFTLWVSYRLKPDPPIPPSPLSDPSWFIKSKSFELLM